MKMRVYNYFIFLLIQVLFFNLTTAYSTVITKNLQTDFGAIGDGITEDQLAFVKAAQYFKNMPSTDQGVLIIPYYQGSSTNPATYLVRPQLEPNESIVKLSNGSIVYVATNNIPAGSTNVYTSSGDWSSLSHRRFLRAPIDLMLLQSDIHDLTICSSHIGLKPKIKYKDGLYFGSWMPPHAPGSSVPYTFVSYTYTCQTCTTVTPTSTQILPNTTDIPGDGVSCNIVGLCRDFSPGLSYTNNSNSIEPMPSWYNTSSLNWNDVKTHCHLGNVFNLQNATNVLIKDIEIDGNITNVMWGSKMNDVGVQGHATGVTCISLNPSAMNCTFDNLYIHHMGTDGFQIAGKSSYVTIINCKSEYNGRQGISWTGGDHLTMESSEFNYNGTLSKIQNGVTVQLSSPPQAGIDIEPNEGSSCIGGNFTGCKFIGNGWKAVANDALRPDVISKDITFTGCEFHDVNGNEGVTVSGQNFLFDECTFHCSVFGVYNGMLVNQVLTADPDHGTKFINHCKFDDLPLTGVQANNGWLMNTFDAKYLLIQDCEFKRYNNGMEIFYMTYSNASPIQDVSEYSIIENCKFDYFNTGNGSVNFISNTRFKGINHVKTNVTQTCVGRILKLSNVFIENGTSCSKDELLIDGKIALKILRPLKVGYYYDQQSNSVLSDGNAALNLKNTAMLFGDKYVNETQSLGAQTNNLLYIGSKAKVDVTNSCSFLIINSVVDGELNIHNGAFIHQNGTIPSLPQSGGGKVITASANANIFISQGCNPIASSGPIPSLPAAYFIGLTPWNSGPNSGTCNGMDQFGLQPVGSGIGGTWNGTINGTCVQGGNMMYNNQVCNPVYSNLNTTGLFSIYYNITDATCGGCNNGQLSFKLTGNSSQYSYSLSGGPSIITPSVNTISNLPSGTYTITFTDANGCSSTLTFQINQPVLSLSISSTPCPGPLTITSTASNGTSPYTYSLNGGPYQSNNVFGNISGNVNYTITVKDANNFTSSVVVNPSICNGLTLGCTLFIEGYTIQNGSNYEMRPAMYNQGVPGSTITDVDDLEVHLYEAGNNTSPIATATGRLNIWGSVLFSNFSSPIPPGNYYVIVYHRNAIPTASQIFPIYTPFTIYYFQYDATGAYASNQFNVFGNLWAFYSGDVNSDYAIDGMDYVEQDTDITNGAFGFFDTDLNGDGVVDSFDYFIMVNNVTNAITSVLP